MPRPPRSFEAGCCYHLLNRGVRRHRLFEFDDDYECFQRLMGAAQRRVPLRLLAYCLMPNHWHLVVWPTDPLAISAYIRWLTWSHACHFNAQHDLSGHVYEGRFKSRVVRDQRHLLTLLCYVEANPVRANLVERAEAWRWSSLHASPGLVLTESPARRPAEWLDMLAEQVPGTVKTLNSTWHLIGHEAGVRRSPTSAPARPGSAAHGVHGEAGWPPGS